MTNRPVTPLDPGATGATHYADEVVSRLGGLLRQVVMARQPGVLRSEVVAPLTDGFMSEDFTEPTWARRRKLRIQTRIFLACYRASDRHYQARSAVHCAMQQGRTQVELKTNVEFIDDWVRK